MVKGHARAHDRAQRAIAFMLVLDLGLLNGKETER
jgi:hypothetical protein